MAGEEPADPDQGEMVIESRMAGVAPAAVGNVTSAPPSTAAVWYGMERLGDETDG